MKYIITDNSINVCIDGRMFTCNKSYEYFNDIKKALERNASSTRVIHLFRKKYSDIAKRLLKK